MVEGTAEVLAPTLKLVLPWHEIARISVQTHDKFEAFVRRVKPLRPVPTAVAHPCDDGAIRAAIDAAQEGMIEPLLVGPLDRIRAAAEASMLSVSNTTEPGTASLANSLSASRSASSVRLPSCGKRLLSSKST